MTSAAGLNLPNFESQSREDVLKLVDKITGGAVVTLDPSGQLVVTDTSGWFDKSAKIISLLTRGYLFGSYAHYSTPAIETLPTLVALSRKARSLENLSDEEKAKISRLDRICQDIIEENPDPSGPFARLPKDVITMILKNLPLEDILKMPSVSKGFKEAAPNAIEMVNERKLTLRELLVSVRRMRGKRIPGSLETKELLQYLKTNPHRAELRYANFGVLHPGAKNHLKLTNDDLRELTRSCPNLETLIMCQACFLDGNALECLENVSKLKYLDISWRIDTGHLAEDSLKYLVHTPELTHLIMNNTFDPIEPDSLKHLVNTPQLTYLNIAHCKNLAPDSLKYLVHTPNLTELAISEDQEHMKQYIPPNLSLRIIVKGYRDK